MYKVYGSLVTTKHLLSSYLMRGGMPWCERCSVIACQSDGHLLERSCEIDACGPETVCTASTIFHPIPPHHGTTYHSLDSLKVKHTFALFYFFFFSQLFSKANQSHTQICTLLAFFVIPVRRKYVQCRTDLMSLTVLFPSLLHRGQGCEARYL